MKTTRTLVFSLFAATAAWSTLPAQTTTPAAAPATPPEEEEVLELSPFEVKADDQNGYLATQTLAGTRIRTDLKDVGSAISVVTKQFMDDIGAVDNSTLLQYTTSAEVSGTRGTYAGLGNGTDVNESGNLRAPGGAQRVRGLAAADNTRDFFVSDIPWDSYNVERVDIQRGPNSILFGLGSPAGIVNYSLNSATYRNGGKVDYRIGSYGAQRASVDYNQVLIDQVLAIRIDGLWAEEKYQQDQAFQNDKRFSGAIRFEPKLFGDSFRTSIKAKYENGDIQANRPRIVPPQDSITPWFRPVNLDPNNLQGGMGKALVPNGYVLGSNAPTYNPWMAGLVNQQQPLWFIDGSSSQLYRIYGGYVNTGALNTAGVPQGVSTSLIGQRYGDVFSTIGGFAAYATNARLTNAQYGQYRNMTLQDSTVFDFYNNLIDGPTKNEWEGWDAYNVELAQTAYDDRLGLQLIYDRQKYERGGQSLLGNPTIAVDILQNFQDYATGPTNAANSNVANSNLGRPYVSAGAGNGSSYESDREYIRGSLYGELRASDFLDKDGFWAKLLGKHRFNGVYSDESYETENRGWNMYANSTAYATFKLQGNPDGITNLTPAAVIYLGPSLLNASSAAGANIPGIQSRVDLPDGNIYQFDATWRSPTGVNYSDPWNVPASLSGVFNGNPVINPATGAPYAQLTQVSNPANYVGWNSNFHNELLRYDNGADQSLVTRASKSMRETKSFAATWQGFLWNDAIVPMLGWRTDEVKSKDVSALPQSGSAARGALNLNPSVYKLPDAYPANRIYEDESTAGGVVVHINKLLGDNDPLPINVSLSYNKSSNFSVVNIRRDIFGNPLPNPTGKTEDYGILLSTKDGKYSFRAIKYKTNQTGVETTLNNSGIFGTIRDAMNWRNIKTYYMSGYAWNTGGQTNTAHFSGVRYMWDPNYINSAGRPVAGGQSTTPPAGSTLETQAQADARRDASIKAINDMQIWLTGKGYFQAWNYGVGPTTQSALQTRGEYEANPKTPDPASVYDYRTAPVMSGFAVTADAQSEGYEFEFTANPLKNWRITFNASQTEATRTNVGGATLDELIAYMDTAMAGPGGDMIMFNSDYSASNQLRFGWNNWRSQYTLMKLQEGSAAPEIREWRYNLITNYSFTNGWAKGIGIGGAYRWQDKVILGYPVVGGAGGIASFDLSQPYYGPSEDGIDLWVSYERKLSSKINWKIQANIRNAFAEEDLIPISVQPDGHTWASVRIAPVQEWFVTNTFSF